MNYYRNTGRQMTNPAQWRHNVDIYIPETAKEHHVLVVVNNGINYEKAQIPCSKPVDFTSCAKIPASIARI